MTDPIVKTVTVACDAVHAFDVFVNRIAKWWPLDGHAVSAAAGKAALAVTIEPKIGGAVYETMYDGTRSDWGRVVAFEPGVKLALTWHPGNNAEHETLVTVEFAQISATQTEVTLSHSGWEIWADEADAKRGNYDQGWNFVFGERYVSAVM